MQTQKAFILRREGGKEGLSVVTAVYQFLSVLMAHAVQLPVDSPHRNQHLPYSNADLLKWASLEGVLSLIHI